MGKFSIDDPAIDVEELERRVDEAISSKLGKRFTESELEELETTQLKPRLRREDLPRGWLEQMAQVRSRLPEVLAPPGSVPVSASEVPPARPPSVGPGSLKFRSGVDSELWSTGATGFRGQFIRLLRRLARPLYRATFNLEHVLTQITQAIDHEVANRKQLEQLADRLNDRLDQTFDLLKANVDERFDAGGDWAGEHMSSMTSRLEQWHERDLHLAHNIVFELTDLRLGLDKLEDRLGDLLRQLENLAARQQAVEEIALESD